MKAAAATAWIVKAEGLFGTITEKRLGSLEAFIQENIEWLKLRKAEEVQSHAAVSANSGGRRRKKKSPAKSTTLEREVIGGRAVQARSLAGATSDLASGKANQQQKRRSLLAGGSSEEQIKQEAPAEGVSARPPGRPRKRPVEGRTDDFSTPSTSISKNIFIDNECLETPLMKTPVRTIRTITSRNKLKEIIQGTPRRTLQKGEQVEGICMQAGQETNNQNGEEATKVDAWTLQFLKTSRSPHRAAPILPEMLKAMMNSQPVVDLVPTFDQDGEKNGRKIGAGGIKRRIEEGGENSTIAIAEDAEKFGNRTKKIDGGRVSEAKYVAENSLKNEIESESNAVTKTTTVPPPPSTIKRIRARGIQKDQLTANVESPLTRAKRVDAQNMWREEQLRHFLSTKAEALKVAIGSLKSPTIPPEVETAPITTKGEDGLSSQPLTLPPRMDTKEMMAMPEEISEKATISQKISERTISKPDDTIGKEKEIIEPQQPAAKDGMSQEIPKEELPEISKENLLPTPPTGSISSENSLHVPDEGLKISSSLGSITMEQVANDSSSSKPKEMDQVVEESKTPIEATDAETKDEGEMIDEAHEEEERFSLMRDKMLDSRLPSRQVSIEPAEVERRRRLKERNDRAVERKRQLAQRALEIKSSTVADLSGKPKASVAASKKLQSNLPIRAPIGAALQKRAVLNNAFKHAAMESDAAFCLPLPKVRSPQSKSPSAPSEGHASPTPKSPSPAALPSSPHLPEIPSDSSDDGGLPLDPAPPSKGTGKDAPPPPPSWAATPELCKALTAQRSIRPEDIFGDIQPVKLEDFFKDSRHRLARNRNSSTWHP